MKQTMKIALTGVMGAGKSSVAALLKEAGITVIDCDEINRDYLRPDALGYQKIVAAFGQGVLNEDRSLNSQALSDQIFTDPRQKQVLEAIMHPLIQDEVLRQMAECNDALVVAEVPLLFESHWETMFDEIWVVRCEEATLLERLQNQRHVSPREARRRLAHQLSQEEKCARAHVVFHNDGDYEALKNQVDAQLKRFKEE